MDWRRNRYLIEKEINKKLPPHNTPTKERPKNATTYRRKVKATSKTTPNGRYMLTKKIVTYFAIFILGFLIGVLFGASNLMRDFLHGERSDLISHHLPPQCQRTAGRQVDQWCTV